jgi:hypothetical protein
LSTETLGVGFDNGPVTTFRQGYEFAPVGGFKRVRLVNRGSTSLTVTVMLYQGAFRDRRFKTFAPVRIVDPFNVAINDQKVFLRAAGASPLRARERTSSLPIHQVPISASPLLVSG